LKHFYGVLPAALTLGVLLLLPAALYIFRTYYRKKRRPPPFTNDFSRFPGQSLLNRLGDINEQIILFTGALFAGPIVFYAAYLSFVYFSGLEIRLPGALATAAIGSGVTVYLLIKLLGYLNERRTLRLGYEGKAAVGQALNQLMLEDYRIYHDFPAKSFNIDHIVVGQNGVFTVRTIALPTPTAKNNRDNATVEYDGRALYFPDYDDAETIAHAEEQALWLSKWIGETIGEAIAVRAIVALPGWVVKRTSAEGISVVNPKQIGSMFQHVKPRPLSADMMAHINDGLERACRDTSFCQTV
jgi:hypothetical protein